MIKNVLYIYKIEFRNNNNMPSGPVPLTWFNLNLKKKKGCVCHKGPKRTVQQFCYINVHKSMNP